MKWTLFWSKVNVWIQLEIDKVDFSAQNNILRTTPADFMYEYNMHFISIKKQEFLIWRNQKTSVMTGYEH